LKQQKSLCLTIWRLGGTIVRDSV